MRVRALVLMAWTVLALATRAFEGGEIAMPQGGDKLNDTGMTYCRLADGSRSKQCDLTGQDAAYGRDAVQGGKNGGRAGFRWVKVAADGKELPESATEWACVKDQHTGLLWEVKTDDDGIRGKTYIMGGNYASVAGYVEGVNATSLCGSVEWRVPQWSELFGIVDLTKIPGAGIDTRWFPNPPSARYTLSADWQSIGANNFGLAPNSIDGTLKTPIWIESGSAVRLVSGARFSGKLRYVVHGQEVLDKATGLVWRRCPVGMAVHSNYCSGELQRLTWGEALQYALDLAAATGVSWRVPNVKELDSTVLSGSWARRDIRAFPGDYGPIMQWSSTPATRSATAVAWCGYENGKLQSAQGSAGYGCEETLSLLLVRSARMADAAWFTSEDGE